VAKHKVYIEVEDRSPFGESVDPRVFEDVEHTSNYIPGYSDKISANDRRKQNHEPIEPLTHRFHWARCKDVRNVDADDGRRVQHWKQKRYQVANYDDVIAQGYNLKENDAIWKDPDGRARWGEHVLMIASAEVAAAHYKKVQDEADELQKEPEYMMENAVERFNRSKAAKRTGMRAGAFTEVEEQ